MDKAQEDAERRVEMINRFWAKRGVKANAKAHPECLRDQNGNTKIRSWVITSDLRFTCRHPAVAR